MPQQRHILLVSYPVQGHINPSLQFAKRLLRMGIQVTFATSVFALGRMTKSSGSIPKGLSFASFSDGYDDGFQPKGVDHSEHMSGMEKHGSNALKNVINTSANQGCPVTGLVCTFLLPCPWATTVARQCHIPSALLWIQPATVMDIFYYYFHGYEDDVKNNSNDPTWSIQFPGLPSMKAKDLPSFILPSSDAINSSILSAFKRQLETLDEEEKPKVLVNTFDALEPQALKAIESYNLIAIGPLTPSAFLDGKDPSETSFSGDLFQKSKDYKEWLNSRPAASVVYVSFGSLLRLPKKQMEEIASGLLKSGRPFLWVIRAKEDGEEEKEEDRLSCVEELEEKGMIVPWCSQIEVLTHPSLGCFLTHCGWNSTLESLVCGVPVIAFPHWVDQGTNAKLIEDVWETGVKVVPNEDGTVDGDEINRCIETVMDDEEKGIVLRRNAMKWKELAREVTQEGGSSDKNLKAFVEEAGKGY
ncbi:crocetin glucosyltransferase, chloroplastic-like [Coffea arabica]|uniref:Glycosyltransferase n=1 Tax=Coffea arabica TaxID=13443 RepID=A0A6P6WWU1_COFAR|nr:crocetin glucosyltransferase, chloroplastic-like [Coffea arabica]